MKKLMDELEEGWSVIALLNGRCMMLKRWKCRRVLKMEVCDERN